MVPMNNHVEPSRPSFYGLGIAPQYLEVIEKLKFEHPTPIQEKAIPLAATGQDVVGIAQTGTGKTLAFGIPMLQRLAQKDGKGLVLAPTRELAMQIFRNLRPLDEGVRMALLIGGSPMDPQIRDLRANPRILIATPGRLIDHMQQHHVSLKDVGIVVLDEADRMLDMGFLPQIQRIFRGIPHQRQTMLFSATMPPEIMRLASAYMKMPTHVEIAKSGTVPEKVTQEVFIVRKDTKKRLLGKLLKEYRGTILVFCRTKIGATKVTRFIRDEGHRVAEIHSDRSMPQRREALEGFRAGRYRILVATDIAARGIDVSGIELVLNYDLPDESENYIHRIGRTGRAGDKGHAISLATPDQTKDVRSIEAVMRTAIPISEHPEMPLEKFIPVEPKLVFSGGISRGGRTRFRLYGKHK